MKKIKTYARFGMLGAVAAFALVLAGCATTDPDESDIPWNTPEPWEGSPFIPGLNQ